MLSELLITIIVFFSFRINNRPSFHAGSFVRNLLMKDKNLSVRQAVGGCMHAPLRMGPGFSLSSHFALHLSSHLYLQSCFLFLSPSGVYTVTRTPNFGLVASTFSSLDTLFFSPGHETVTGLTGNCKK